jgi:ornithine cyclodeaminase/alanine dehydrogenase-like protein (mu-crystallin family)
MDDTLSPVAGSPLLVLSRRELTDVHAELGELVAGRKAGRGSAAEITIFDGSRLGILDVAAHAFDLARQRGMRGNAQLD